MRLLQKYGSTCLALVLVLIFYLAANVSDSLFEHYFPVKTQSHACSSTNVIELWVSLSAMLLIAAIVSLKLVDRIKGDITGAKAKSIIIVSKIATTTAVALVGFVFLLAKMANPPNLGQFPLNSVEKHFGLAMGIATFFSVAMAAVAGIRILTKNAEAEDLEFVFSLALAMSAVFASGVINIQLTLLTVGVVIFLVVIGGFISRKRGTYEKHAEGA